MLVLSRKSRESIVIGDNTFPNRFLKITVLDMKGGTVKLGFEAAADVLIHRSEVWQRICRNRPTSSEPVARVEAVAT
jgi:carbon storage regulator